MAKFDFFTKTIVRDITAQIHQKFTQAQRESYSAEKYSAQGRLSSAGQSGPGGGSNRQARSAGRLITPQAVAPQHAKQVEHLQQSKD